jgi:hypothetical protein
MGNSTILIGDINMPKTDAQEMELLEMVME